MIHGTFLNFLYDIIWQSNFDSPKILVKQVKSKKENNDGVKKLLVFSENHKSIITIVKTLRQNVRIPAAEIHWIL